MDVQFEPLQIDIYDNGAEPWLFHVESTNISHMLRLSTADFSFCVSSKKLHRKFFLHWNEVSETLHGLWIVVRFDLEFGLK